MFIEIALPVFSPFGIAFIRNLLGAAVLWSYLFYKKISIPRDRSVFGWIFLIGLCSNIIPVVIVPFAQTEVTSSLTGIVNAMSPIFAVIFTLLLFKHEAVKPIQIFGILLAFFGVAIVFGIWDIESAPWWAYLFLLIAVTSFGLVAPIIAKYIAPKNYPPVALATIQVTIAAVVLFPTFVLFGFNSYDFSFAPITRTGKADRVPPTRATGKTQRGLPSHDPDPKVNASQIYSLNRTPGNNARMHRCLWIWMRSLIAKRHPRSTKPSEKR